MDFLTDQSETGALSVPFLRRSRWIQGATDGNPQELLKPNLARISPRSDLSPRIRDRSRRGGSLAPKIIGVS
jgi:hypothetical protein